MSEPSFYAKLLGESFESLRSVAEPGMRASTGSMIEIVTPTDPVLGKEVPVPENVRSALVQAGIEVQDKGKDNSEDGIKSNPDDTSLEASTHHVEAMLTDGHSSGSSSNGANLIVNGVHVADADSAGVPVVAIMTPNDVIPPRAEIILLQGDDENGMAKDYLCTEGYRVAGDVDELIRMLKA